MIDYLASLSDSSSALAAAARSAGLSAPVPSCPGWQMSDLVGHVLVIHRWVAEVVRTRADARPDRDTSVPAEPELLDAFESGADELVAVLRDAPLDAPAYNWTLTEPWTAAFWRRRMAQETAVHRWDGEHAAGGAGAPSPFEPALAVDGLNELFDVFLPVGVAVFPDRSLAGSLHFHCTDTDGEWLVAFGGGAVDVRREHAKGDAAVRGTASDLLLFAWNRLAPDDPALSVFGDPAVLESWRAVAI